MGLITHPNGVAFVSHHKMVIMYAIDTYELRIGSCITLSPGSFNRARRSIVQVFL